MRAPKFPKGKPKYWYAEYDVETKILEVRLGRTIIQLPQELILGWFMEEEYNTMRIGGKNDGKDNCM